MASALAARPTLSIRLLGLVVLFWHLLGLYSLLSHSSDQPLILGRYSNAYAAALLIALGLLLPWLLLLIQPRRVQDGLRGLPLRIRYGALAAALLLVGLMWFSSIENRLQFYFSASGFWLWVLFVRSQTDQPARGRYWSWALLIGLLLFLVPVTITALSGRPFSPDEASWASGAISYFQVGGVYKPHLLSAPFVIQPGYGWSLAAYGWLLENISFNPFTGRLWNLAFYGLAFGGIGLVAWRLYGRAVAFISAAIALLSFYFISALDYRPSHQLPFAAMLVIFAALQARYSQRPAYRRFWHFLCGLLVTLAMQLHAGAVVYIFNLSLYYLLEGLLSVYRQRHRSALEPLLFYGLGAGLGAGFFFVFNVLPIGGLDLYLAYLGGTRWNLSRSFSFLNISYRLDIFLPLLAIAYLVWRRSPADRQYLGLLGLTLLGIVLFDSQGYRETYIALYAVPVGVLLVDALASPGIERGQNRHSRWISAGLLLVMAGSWLPGFIDGALLAQTLREGRLPPHTNILLGEAIRPFTSQDDVILSTHELIWEFHEPGDQLYSVVAETYAPVWMDIEDPLEVWEYIAPTVIIDVQSRMDLPASLLAYMEAEAFQVCHAFEASAVRVTVYRRLCDEAGAQP